LPTPYLVQARTTSALAALSEAAVALLNEDSDTSAANSPRSAVPLRGRHFFPDDQAGTHG